MAALDRTRPENQSFGAVDAGATQRPPMLLFDGALAAGTSDLAGSFLQSAETWPPADLPYAAQFSTTRSELASDASPAIHATVDADLLMAGAGSPSMIAIGGALLGVGLLCLALTLLAWHVNRNDGSVDRQVVGAASPFDMWLRGRSLMAYLARRSRSIAIGANRLRSLKTKDRRAVSDD